MDIIFGSSGVAAADAERMKEINREVGLDDLLAGRAHVDEKVQEPANEAAEGSDREINEEKLA